MYFILKSYPSASAFVNLSKLACILNHYTTLFLYSSGYEITVCIKYPVMYALCIKISMEINGNLQCSKIKH